MQGAAAAGIRVPPEMRSAIGAVTVGDSVIAWPARISETVRATARIAVIALALTFHLVRAISTSLAGSRGRSHGDAHDTREAPGLLQRRGFRPLALKAARLA